MNVSQGEPALASRCVSKKKQPSEPDLLVCVHNNADVTSGGNAPNVPLADTLGAAKKPFRLPALNKGDSAYIKQRPPSFKETNLDQIINPFTIKDLPQVACFSSDRSSEKHEGPNEDRESPRNGTKNSPNPETEVSQRLPVRLEEKRNSVELPDDEEGCGDQVEELDLVEPWEDLSSTKQWVTSPLHSPDIEELFNQLSPFGSKGETRSSGGGKTSPSGDGNKPSFVGRSEQPPGSPPQSVNSETKGTRLPTTQLSLSSSNTTQPPTAKGGSAKQKTAASSQRFTRQTSFETAVAEKREESRSSKNRPCSLNLDLSHRYIRDISNQQHCNSAESSSKGLLASPGAKGRSDLELFLNDRQAPLRRNSAPVSVSSVRTAFMIKKCQARAVPVVPPKVQYSQIPQTKLEGDTGKEQDKGCPKTNAEPSAAALPLMMMDLKEELENKEPGLKHQKTPNLQKSAESGRNATIPELPVITRRHAPSLEVFVDCPRPNRGTLLQRPSFRNRQRPQSLILLSPPFPIMDYPSSGDDGKLLSSIKSLNDTAALNVFSKEMAENFRTPEGISLQNKMTIPKSGQRLETSTSCFYQPQRRSMIFDSRSHRQIE